MRKGDKVIIVVAWDEDLGIGKDNKLPWHIKQDMVFFKTLSTTVVEGVGGDQNAVVMGRKTWESIPDKFRPLKDRLNVVLTRNEDYEVPEGVLKHSSYSEAIRDLKDLQDAGEIQTVYIIGGAEIYNEAILNDSVDSMIVTEVEGTFDCDAFFPSLFIEYFSPGKEMAEFDGDISAKVRTYNKVEWGDHDLEFPMDEEPF